MADDKVYADPSDVEVEDGIVAVDGPDSVDVHLTPEAAEETSHRLLAGAMMAKGQEAARRQGKKRHLTDP
ncbi:MAG: hypothetical protein ACJ8DZ_08705 [Allosphingosinicella sp.]